MRTRRLIAGLALVAVVLAGWAAAAAAHVTIQPPEAAAGGYAKITFRVPNERPGASTTKLAVQFPKDSPFASVSVKPVPGWTATRTMATPDAPTQPTTTPVTEAVSTIVWTGGEIKPGEFQEFEVNVGPLPKDPTTLYFPAIQTYSNGEEVAWIERPATGAEAKNPAPALKVVAAASTSTDPGNDHAAGGAGAPANTASPSTVAASSNSATSSTSASPLAWVALIVGALGLVAGVAALARGRSASTSAG